MRLTEKLWKKSSFASGEVRYDMVIDNFEAHIQGLVNELYPERNDWDWSVGTINGPFRGKKGKEKSVDKAIRAVESALKSLGVKISTDISQERMPKLILDLEKYVIKETEKRPSTAPIVMQLIEGLSNVKESLKGQMNLTGEEAVKVFVSEALKHFTFYARPLSRLQRKYGDIVNKMRKGNKMDNNKIAKELIKISRELLAKHWRAKIDIKRIWEEIQEKDESGDLTIQDIINFKKEIKDKLLDSTIKRAVGNDLDRWEEYVNNILDMDNEDFNFDDFNAYWNDIYDIADRNDIWISVF